MLVGRRMEHYLGDASCGTHKSTRSGLRTSPITGTKFSSLVFLFQFQTEIMHRGLSGVEANQLLNREMSQLATDLATDTAGGSRDKHGLPFQQIADFVQINMDLLTTQQILDTDLTDRTLSPHLHVAPPSPELPTVFNEACSQ